jgi:hypothetical protein
MDRDSSLGRGRWSVLIPRSILVGAVAGVTGGWLLYFLFGFVGFSGASVAARLENGWDAAIDIGLRRGLVVGLGIALGLAAASTLWIVSTDRFHPPRARPWLSGFAALIVVMSNLSSLRQFRGWDVVGILTVLGMAILVAGVVWLVAPWVLDTPERKPSEPTVP